MTAGEREMRATALKFYSLEARIKVIQFENDNRWKKLHEIEIRLKRKNAKLFVLMRIPFFLKRCQKK